jgi:hypothetical protein
MRLFIAIALSLTWLLAGVAMTACSNDGGDYYENETHGGYPGPGTRTQNRN